MKRFELLGRSLTRDEMRQIKGALDGMVGEVGNETIYGWCTEHVGCWSTSSSKEVCEADIANNCRGGGECSATNGCPW